MIIVKIMVKIVVSAVRLVGGMLGGIGMIILGVNESRKK